MNIVTNALERHIHLKLNNRIKLIKILVITTNFQNPNTFCV